MRTGGDSSSSPPSPFPSSASAVIAERVSAPTVRSRYSPTKAQMRGNAARRSRLAILGWRPTPTSIASAPFRHVPGSAGAPARSATVQVGAAVDVGSEAGAGNALTNRPGASSVGAGTVEVEAGTACAAAAATSLRTSPGSSGSGVESSVSAWAQKMGGVRPLRRR